MVSQFMAEFVSKILLYLLRASIKIKFLKDSKKVDHIFVVANASKTELKLLNV